MGVGGAGIGPEKEQDQGVIEGLTAILWLFLEFVPSDQPPAIRWPVELLQHDRLPLSFLSIFLLLLSLQ